MPIVFDVSPKMKARTSILTLANTFEQCASGHLMFESLAMAVDESFRFKDQQGRAPTDPNLEMSNIEEAGRVAAADGNVHKRPTFG